MKHRLLVILALTAASTLMAAPQNKGSRPKEAVTHLNSVKPKTSGTAQAVGNSSAATVKRDEKTSPNPAAGNSSSTAAKQATTTHAAVRRDEKGHRIHQR